MVIRPSQIASRHGFFISEMVLALAILLIAVVPFALVASSDVKLFRGTYQRTVAMEIVDGEIEILAAGAWRDFPEGSHPYAVHANAAANLPPGKFKLTRTGNHLRLEWSSAKKIGIKPVVREVNVK